MKVASIGIKYLFFFLFSDNLKILPNEYQMKVLSPFYSFSSKHHADKILHI